MKKDIVRVIIERYDPENKRSYTDSYDVPRGSKLRVLDFLDYIFEEIDPTLTYRRHLCKAKMCNACLMMVNEKPRFACWEIVLAGQHEISLAPLKGKAVLKDLVVDFGDSDDG
jgi:succinate dehydrogenase/fumarate reductase-like Fe-S protein